MAVTPLRWRARPRSAFAVRAGVFIAPIAAAVAVSVAISRLLPAPTGTADLLLWWAVFVAAAIAVDIGVGRILRRFLPLAALLELSLLFPDAAPSRVSVALQASSGRVLRREIDLALRDQSPDRARRAEKILGLLAALALHDRSTRGHSERVRAFTDLIAGEMRLPEPDRDRLRWAALLHDIGKLAVPPSVLNKRGRPEPDEWADIHRHPEAGARLIAPLAPWLGDWARAVGEHHERWDGSGYPGHLSGSAIALGARIVAVADAYEVMTSPRSYKAAMTPGAAREELVRCAGDAFDPEVVRAFLNVSTADLRRTIGYSALAAQAPLFPLLKAAAARAAAAPAATTAGAAVTVASITVLYTSGAAAVLPSPVSGSAVAAAAAAPTPTPARSPAVTAPTCTPGPTSPPATASPSPSASPRQSPTPTATPSVTPTATPTPSPVATATHSPATASPSSRPASASPRAGC